MLSVIFPREGISKNFIDHRRAIAGVVTFDVAAVAAIVLIAKLALFSNPIGAGLGIAALAVALAFANRSVLPLLRDNRSIPVSLTTAQKVVAWCKSVGNFAYRHRIKLITGALPFIAYKLLRKPKIRKIADLNLLEKCWDWCLDHRKVTNSALCVMEVFVLLKLYHFYKQKNNVTQSVYNPPNNVPDQVQQQVNAPVQPPIFQPTAVKRVPKQEQSRCVVQWTQDFGRKIAKTSNGVYLDNCQILRELSQREAEALLGIFSIFPDSLCEFMSRKFHVLEDGESRNFREMKENDPLGIVRYVSVYHRPTGGQFYVPCS